jgi:hypothetical protein
MVDNIIQLNPSEFSIAEREYLYALDRQLEDTKRTMAEFIAKKRIQLDAEQKKIAELAAKRTNP